jgi:ABC-2 type transport system permease protein
MLADAYAAERFRLLRDRAALFWGFVFAPLAGLAMSVGGDLFMHRVFHRALPGAQLDLGGKLLSAVSGATSPFVALFLLIGAAAILAGDYRWETWRLITPRNGRGRILLAKLLVFGEATAWSLGLMAACALLAGLIGGAINGMTVVAPGGAFIGRLAGALVIVWLQLMIFGALVACVAVAARSTLGAVVAGVLVLIGQSIAASMHGMDPAPSLKALLLPAYAADQMRAFVLAPAGLRPDGQTAALGLLISLAWLAGLTAVAATLFRRQDLTRE